MIVKVLDIYKETPTVFVLKFEKPSDFIYKPGQFVDITLDVPDCDTRRNKRSFSLLSIPTDDYLMTATREGVSRYKQEFAKLQAGSSINISNPMGHFVLNEDPHIPAVLLSGGIGITPLHGMTKYAAHHSLAKPITLIYSNASSIDVPFKKDIDEYDRSDMAFRAFYTMTDEASTNWKGLSGRIDEEMIKKTIPDWQKSEYYICGPAQMVIALKRIVISMGIPESRVKFELFTGYS